MKAILFFLGRFALSLLLLAVFLLVAAVALRPWYGNWGATAEETSMPLPGDELISNAARQDTLGITVAASREAIWPWLAQIGAGRGGLYSYSWLESLVNCPVRNASQVIPDLQNPQVGDLVRMCPGDFGPPPHHIASLQAGRAFIFGGRDQAGAGWDSTWQFVLVPQTGNSTRLLLRLRSASSSAFDTLLAPAFFFMERRRLQGIRERAEGQIRAEWQIESEMMLWIAALIGFMIAGGLLVFRKAWRQPAILAGCAALLILCLAFAQPPWWVDFGGVAAIYAGLVWILSATGKPHLSWVHSRG